MTKADLIRALEPFTDDIEIVLATSSHYKVHGHSYGVDERRDGVFVLVALNRPVEIKRVDSQRRAQRSGT